MDSSNSVAGFARNHVNFFAELLHKHNPASALSNFSKYLEKQKLDVLSNNAVNFVTSTEQANNSEELLSRVQHAKSQIETCSNETVEFASKKLKNRTVVVHPLESLGAAAANKAKNVRFLNANPELMKSLSSKHQAHQPLDAVHALDDADLLLLEPHAIVPDGLVAKQGSKLLVELALSKGIPVYALGTSWHASQNWNYEFSDECISENSLTGVISEHGIYSHAQFLARVKKSFPWIF